MNWPVVVVRLAVEQRPGFVCTCGKLGRAPFPLHKDATGRIVLRRSG
jgi:hypothetical protein